MSKDDMENFKRTVSELIDRRQEKPDTPGRELLVFSHWM